MAGQAEHRLSADVAEHRGLAGAHGEAVEEQPSPGRDDPADRVALPGGAAAGYDEDVAALQSPAYGGVERLYLVAYYAELHRLAAAAADQGAEHRGVHVPHLAGAGDAVGGHQLVAGA